MTQREIANLVGQGFLLDQEIKERSKRLEEIKDLLATAANGNVCKFAGDGCEAAVNFSARLASRVEEEKLPKCRKLCGDYFEKLFGFAPIEKFRDVAKALIGPEKAEQLVELLNGLPGPRVSFKKC